jgi:hypothetical protein
MTSAARIAGSVEGGCVVAARMRALAADTPIPVVTPGVFAAYNARFAAKTLDSTPSDGVFAARGTPFAAKTPTLPSFLPRFGSDSPAVLQQKRREFSAFFAAFSRYFSSENAEPTQRISLQYGRKTAAKTLTRSGVGRCVGDTILQRKRWGISSHTAANTQRVWGRSLRRCGYSAADPVGWTRGERVARRCTGVHPVDRPYHPQRAAIQRLSIAAKQGGCLPRCENDFFIYAARMGTLPLLNLLMFAAAAMRARRALRLLAYDRLKKFRSGCGTPAALGRVRSTSTVPHASSDLSCNSQNLAAVRTAAKNFWRHFVAAETESARP